MASFVLIHGAWHGGWCFDALRPLLEAHGHSVTAPDLPGMGDDADARARVTLAEWGDFAADLCRAADQPVILVGHSRGGIVISEAAERAPNSLAALVYLCAMLVPDGMSRAEMKAQSEPNPDFDAIRHAVPDGTIIDPTNAVAVFAQLSPPDLAAAAAARLVAEPAAPTDTRLQLSDARYGLVPRHYIECLADRTIPIADQRRMQATQPCTSVVSLNSDHSPFLSAPQELADALCAIADAYVPAG
jgi:pimeloyl-ACP methyl ester carboxylesterase